MAVRERMKTKGGSPVERKGQRDGEGAAGTAEGLSVKM